MDKKMNMISRRAFIAGAATATAGFTILPSHVIAGLGHKAPSDKLNIAGIGVGGYGYINLRNVENENIVALCDIDWDLAANSFKRWPMAKQHRDYRVMLDQQKDIDAVVIATPDHSHALPAVLAMRAGKHVYLQTPLTHSIYEARLLADNARRYGVATQMGNQGNSGEDVRRICEWIWAGVIGEVTHADAWTNRPTWPQFLKAPERGRRAPRNLEWDLFVGPAAWYDYHPDFHPWLWRAWWNFGTGAAGDMGPHILEPIYKALMLEHPKSVEASSSGFNIHSLPNSELIRYEFSRRDNLPKVAMPEVTVHWYDGGLMPPRPSELNPGDMMGDENGGCIFYGTRGKIMCGTYGQNPTLLPLSEMENFQEPQKTIRRVFNPLDGGHEQDWVRAAKEPGQTRLNTSSGFEYAGPLTEMVLLGLLAVRMQSLGRKLEWDASNMRFTNISSQDVIRIQSESDFEIASGKPRYNTKFATLKAVEASEQWIRRNYRQGWEQI